MSVATYPPVISHWWSLFKTLDVSWYTPQTCVSGTRGGNSLISGEQVRTLRALRIQISGVNVRISTWIISNDQRWRCGSFSSNKSNFFRVVCSPKITPLYATSNKYINSFEDFLLFLQLLNCLSFQGLYVVLRPISNIPFTISPVCQLHWRSDRRATKRLDLE